MARVPYRDPDEIPPEYGDLVVSSLQPGKTVNVYRAVANNPPVLAGLREYLGALWTDSGLTDRERELVILAVARELDNSYEWHQHVTVAGTVGIPDEDVLAIGTGDLGSLVEHERALVRYAVAVANGDVDGDLHDEVAATYDDATVTGVAALVAGYVGLARIIDALDVELEDDFVGWDPAGPHR